MTKLTTFKVLVPSKYLSEVISEANDEEEARQEFHFHSYTVSTNPTLTIRMLEF